MNLPRRRPARVAIAGMGGFAAEHHRVVAALEREGACRLVATCDPFARELAGSLAGLDIEGRGARVFTDYGDMLEACASRLDYVVVSTPVPLHAPMHAEAVARGVPVYLEKPPTLDPAELERMIATEDSAPASTLVAFNYMVEPRQLALKRRLLDGEFGAVRRASLRALSPRPVRYYARAPWAGRARLGDAVVLDSCLGNALAHSVHNLLFWAGERGVHDWSAPAEVEAAFHRAHAIEGPDTVFVSCRLESGVPLRIAVSHAGAGEATCVETVDCEHARIVSRPGRVLDIRWNGGRWERHPAAPFDGVRAHHLAYQRHLLGMEPRVATSLQDSRPFVALNALSWISAGPPATLPSRRVTAEPGINEGGCFLVVDELEATQTDFIEHGRWPDRPGWGAVRGRVARPADLPRLAERLEAFAATTPAPRSP